MQGGKQGKEGREAHAPLSSSPIHRDAFKREVEGSETREERAHTRALLDNPNVKLARPPLRLRRGVPLSGF
jgi:hypothetical protein